MRVRGGIGDGDLAPDVRGPARYLAWVLSCQPWRVVRAALLSTVWMTGLALPPYLVSRAVDDGLRGGDTAALLGWTAAVVLTALLSAVLGLYRHRTMTMIRIDVIARTMRVLNRHAARAGAALPRTVSAGEVASVGGPDARAIAEATLVAGPGIGAVVAYAVVGIVLVGISPVLAAVVLLGVPAILLAMLPLLRRLQVVQTAYRVRQGETTAVAGDIVTGLRVLAGLGGQAGFLRRYTAGSRRLRDSGYRAAATGSWVEAVAVGAPALFLAVVVWLAARLAVRGEITVGQLVAVYGYVVQLAVPVWFLLEGALGLTKGLVAARRVVALLRVAPDHRDHADPGGRVPDPLGDLVAAGGAYARLWRSWHG